MKFRVLAAPRFFMAVERSDGTQEEVVIEGGQLFLIMVSMTLIRYDSTQTGCLLLLHGSKGTAVASLMVLDLTPVFLLRDSRLLLLHFMFGTCLCAYLSFPAQR